MNTADGGATGVEFGAVVTVSAVYRRRYQHNEQGPRWGVRKYWDAWKIKPRDGLYIGGRTLSNGQRWYEDEVGAVYEPAEYFRAALVVFSERERPVLVPLDALAQAGVGE